METERLNDNEVKEIARMQRLIMKYENAIDALFLKAKCNVDVKLLVSEERDKDKEINFLWKWICENKDKLIELQDGKAE